MPMDPNKVSDYMHRAGLTEGQLAQMVGTITVQPENARIAIAAGLQVDAIQQAILQRAQHCTIITALYNAVARASAKDPRQVASQADLDADRALLNEMFADEYLLTDPAGNVANKAKVIENILGGQLVLNAFGQGGFESTQGALQIHGQTAVLTGEFKYAGRALPEGGQQRVPRSGTIRSTHTYVFRNGSWQLSATALVNVPGVRTDWVLAG